MFAIYQEYFLSNVHNAPQNDLTYIHRNTHPVFESAKMAVITLGYWDIRGLAQPIRMILEYVGANWKEDSYSCGPAPDYDRYSVI